MSNDAKYLENLQGFITWNTRWQNVTEKNDMEFTSHTVMTREEFDFPLAWFWHGFSPRHTHKYDKIRFMLHKTVYTLHNNHQIIIVSYQCICIHYIAY